MNAPFRIIDTPERVRLSVDDFLLLNDSGAFDGWTKTELIDGEIYGMNAQHSRHARAKSRLAMALALRLRDLGSDLGSDLEALVEVTVRVSSDSAPEPDIVLTCYRGDREVPVETVALVVEIADTTLENDLGRKAELYAAAGIAEYWVVDVNERRVLMHEQPGEIGFAEQIDVPFGEPLLSATIEGLIVETAGLDR
jgi:Uma2 family endonuclease